VEDKGIKTEESLFFSISLLLTIESFLLIREEGTNKEDGDDEGEKEGINKEDGDDEGVLF
jgi:hypothetical protein